MRRRILAAKILGIFGPNATDMILTIKPVPNEPREDNCKRPLA